MEKNNGYVNLIITNLIEFMLAILFLLVFVLIGYLGSYLVAQAIIGDIIIAGSIFIGLLTLLVKIIKEKV